MVEPSGHFARYGQGSYVRSAPKEVPIEFQSFVGGYFSATNRKMVPENSSPFAIDFEVTSNDRLRRSPGTSILESFETRTPDKMVVHGSLDFTAELVFFDPPFLGVKRLGDTVWADKGFIEDGWWAWTNFGGTLIFSDGDAVYARQVNDGTTTSVVAEAPVAVTYESWAARVWAGGAIIDENFEQLGLVWSAANSDFTDWTGEGSGFELLIDSISAGDRIVRLKSMNLDFMAVFMRKSIWLVKRTADANRPGDPQPRIAGKGAINHDVVQSTEKGVITVTDGGVELFDGNTCLHLSDGIDAELLPLDYGAILEYSSSYDTIRNRYILHDPRGTTWILDLNKGRWYRRSLNAIASVEWPLQAEDAIVEGEPRMVFLGDQMDESVTPRTLAEEDQDSFENFGVPLTPIWTTRAVSKLKMNELLTAKLFNVEYLGAGDLEIWSPDLQGNFDLLIMEGLVPKTELDIVDIAAGKTGRLASIMIRLTDGDIEIAGLQCIAQERGPRVAIGPGGLVGTFPDRTTLLDFPQGQPWTNQHGPGGPGPELAPVWLIVIVWLFFFEFEFSVSGEDPPEEITEYFWDFGDGETETTTEPTTTHTYSGPGTYDGYMEARINGFTWSRYPWRRVVAEADGEGPATEEVTIEASNAATLTGPGGMVWSVTHDTPEAAYSTAGLYASIQHTPDFGYVLLRGWVGFNHTREFLSASLFVPNSVFARSVEWTTGREVGLYVGLLPLTGEPDDYDLLRQATVLACDDLLVLPPGAAAPASEVEFVLNAAGLAQLNETGFVYFAIRTDSDVLNTDPAGEYISEAGASAGLSHVPNAWIGEELGVGANGTFTLTTPNLIAGELVGKEILLLGGDFGNTPMLLTTVLSNTTNLVSFVGDATGAIVIQYQRTSVNIPRIVGEALVE